MISRHNKTPAWNILPICKYFFAPYLRLTIIDTENNIKFLLLKYPSYWGYVKGIIEDNEDEQEAAIRELEEEVGISKIEIIPGFEEKQEWFFKFDGKTIKKQAKKIRK